ncbi:hypothetical protein ACFOWM_12675 [Ferruginibacter yonginensis]|uniref:DUF4082 domain-containing protein n=1 Tax=Ferruginibacter yonginensis TaxID=1310416 RepID=A0ABV8QU73_9BACT
MNNIINKKKNIMRSFFKKLLFAISVVMVVQANAQQTLDQSNTTFSTNTGLSPNSAAGQIFRAGITGNLTQVDFRLFSTSSAATNNFNVVIYNATATSVNTASIVSTTTFSSTAISTSPGWYSMPITTATPLIAGNYYAVVINNASTSNTLIYEYETTGSYANGTYVFNVSGFTPLSISASSDIAFRTYVTPPAPLSNVGIGTPTPNASAKLDVSSTTQGMLVPRMTAAQRTAIASPATGLMVYQTDAPAGFYFYNGAAWVPSQTVPAGGTTGQVLTKVDATDFNTQWATPLSGGARLELRATKNTTQTLVLSTSASPDLVTYESVVTTPTLGTYANNAYTVGTNGAGLYLIQTRNSMVDNATPNNTLGAYNYLEVNGSAYGSFNNIYPSFVSNVSIRSATNSAIRSGTQYMFLVFLNAGDVIRIRATGTNSSTPQALSNDGGTQLMIVKL